MKHLVFLSLLFSFACSNPVSNGYQIKGDISGKTPAMAYLQTYTNGELVVLDSSKFLNGKFTFSGSVSNPEQQYIKIGENRPISIFVENSKIKIQASIDSLDKAKISGSEIHDQLIRFNEDMEPFNNEMREVYKKFKTTTEINEKKELENILDSIYETQIEFTKEYVKENTNSILSAYLIRTQLIHSTELNELVELTDLLSPTLKESKYTKYLIERINLLRRLQPGEMAPTFSQTDTQGNTVNLSDFKGKYLLIDFWASWCGPCRRANPTIVELYNKFNKRGLEILGVSMDSDKEKWLQAISDDGLSWQQVSTLEGWKNPAGKLYGVNSIPHAILIDPEGKIVKRGIHADELNDLLSGLLN